MLGFDVRSSFRLTPLLVHEITTQTAYRSKTMMTLSINNVVQCYIVFRHFTKQRVYELIQIAYNVSST